MADTQVRSEITGTVWKVLVNVGDEVKADTPVALVESMKMEIPVIASDDGVIVAVLVAPGDPIVEGQPVVSLRL